MVRQSLLQRYAQGETNFRRLDLAGADLTGVVLAGGDLRESDLQRANLHGANLSRCRLQKANLRGARLTLTNLQRADLRESNLSLCFLVGCDLRGANLQGSDLRSAVLDQPRPYLSRWLVLGLNVLAFLATLGCGLYRHWTAALGLVGLLVLGNGALMRWRSPTAADLRGADLRGANLTGARLWGMYLLGVRCEGAILPNGQPYRPWYNWFPWD
ncbi:MAG: pentapeptide repeat-containing protein [Gloeomargarita sp. SKYBB_i_bin120]|nr:pentapeptide repeat-containing protein [Gloeomargarita sp. SKYG98]MCS7293329.1 pentapeptide repeat-containing protein [Gloeomargarita sp. SKYB120]MDW8178894.1 pentapeptide repeat-containing protein [Gloeomargarita sp. SKYBB_i_bin120]